MRDGKPKPDWLCKFCERGPRNAPLSNHGTRLGCRGCGIAKGAAFLRNDDKAAAPGGGKEKGKTGTFAEQQVAASKRQDAKDRRIAELEKKLAAAKTRVAPVGTSSAEKQLAAEKTKSAAASAGSTAAEEVYCDICRDHNCGVQSHDAQARQRAAAITAQREAVLAIEAMPAAVQESMPGALTAAKARLDVLVKQRDEGRSPNSRFYVAKSQLAKREKASLRTAAAKDKAAEELWAARKAMDEAQAADDLASEQLAMAKQELTQAATGLSDACDDGHPTPQAVVSGATWDTVGAVLKQLQHLPAAIQAGNGETAWASIQQNGLLELQSAWDKRALAKAQEASVAETAAAKASHTALAVPTVASRVGAMEAATPSKAPLFPNASGLDGLKGIFTAPRNAKDSATTSGAEKM